MTADQLRYRAWLNTAEGAAIYADLSARLALIRPDMDEVILRRRRAAGKR